MSNLILLFILLFYYLFYYLFLFILHNVATFMIIDINTDYIDSWRWNMSQIFIWIIFLNVFSFYFCSIIRKKKCANVMRKEAEKYNDNAIT